MPPALILIARLAAFAFGVWLVVFTVLSAIRTFVVPRNENPLLTKFVFTIVRTLIIPYDPDPQPGDPISITRAECDAAYDELIEKGVPVRPDRDACWEAFTGWRINYDAVLVQLARFLHAPYAAWITDRKLPE